MEDPEETMRRARFAAKAWAYVAGVATVILMVMIVMWTRPPCAKADALRPNCGKASWLKF